MTDVGLKRLNTAKGHWYKLDGEKVDGVTTLLGKGIPKPALINWAGNTTAAYAVDHWDELTSLSTSRRLDELKKARFADRDQAARRGTEVHGLAEKLMNGEEIDVPEELAGHVESCVKYLDQWQPIPILTETTVASRRWRYAGTLDAVVDLPDGRRALMDYKTSRSGIFGETALQLAAYAHAEFYLDENSDEQSVPDLGIQLGMAVWIRSDGYDVYEVDISDNTFKSFMYAATVARRCDDLRALVSPALPIPALEAS